MIESLSGRNEMGNSESICLYIISTHYGTYYTGITNNLIRRWREHGYPKKTWLSRHKPFEVVHLEFYGNRKSAAKQERRVKDLGAWNYMNKLKYRK